MANLGSSPDFQDFDDESIYNRFEAAILKTETQNIVIEFGTLRARAALDVDGSAIQTALESEVRTSSRHTMQYD